MCVAIGGFPWFQKTPVLLRLSVVAIMDGVTTPKGSLSRHFSSTAANDQAPSFDSIPQFDKETNGLFPVHVHVSEKGLIFVNLSADQNVTPFEVQPFIESLI